MKNLIIYMAALLAIAAFAAPAPAFASEEDECRCDSICAIDTAALAIDSCAVDSAADGIDTLALQAGKIAIGELGKINRGAPTPGPLPKPGPKPNPGPKPDPAPKPNPNPSPNPNPAPKPENNTLVIDWIDFRAASSSPDYSFKIGVKSQSQVTGFNVSVNGVSLRGMNAVKNDGYDFEKTTKVNLRPGQNTITVTVTNAAGPAVSEKTVIYNR